MQRRFIHALVQRLLDPCHVTVDIADDRVRLGKSDLHPDILRG